jgi:hypothetical protein
MVTPIARSPVEYAQPSVTPSQAAPHSTPVQYGSHPNRTAPSFHQPERSINNARFRHIGALTTPARSTDLDPATSFQRLEAFGQHMLTQVCHSQEFGGFLPQMRSRHTPPDQIRRHCKQFRDTVVYPKCNGEFNVYGGRSPTCPRPDDHARRIVDRLDELRKEHLDITPLNPERRLGSEDVKLLWQKPSRKDKLKNLFVPGRKKRLETLKSEAQKNIHYLVTPNGDGYRRPVFRFSNVQSEFSINVDPFQMDEFLRRLPKLFRSHGSDIESITVHPPKGQHELTSSVTISFAGRDHQQKTSREISQYLRTQFRDSTWGPTAPGGLRVGSGNHAVGSYMEFDRSNGGESNQKQIRSAQIAEAITNCLAAHRGSYESARRHLGTELREIVRRSNYNPDSVGLIKD